MRSDLAYDVRCLYRTGGRVQWRPASSFVHLISPRAARPPSLGPASRGTLSGPSLGLCWPFLAGLSPWTEGPGGKVLCENRRRIRSGSKQGAPRRPGERIGKLGALLGCDFQRPLHQGLPPSTPSALGKDWPGAPLPSRGRPTVPAPVLGIEMLVLGLVQAFWPRMGGEGSLPSPPPEVPWLSLFCQGDLFNHLIFWWPFIPCCHGYGPIKGRSNKAASQTGNKNIKAHVHTGRAGGGKGLSEVRQPGEATRPVLQGPPERLAAGLGLGDPSSFPCCWLCPLGAQTYC